MAKKDEQLTRNEKIMGIIFRIMKEASKGIVVEDTDFINRVPALLLGDKYDKALELIISQDRLKHCQHVSEAIRIFCIANEHEILSLIVCYLEELDKKDEFDYLWGRCQPFWQEIILGLLEAITDYPKDTDKTEERCKKYLCKIIEIVSKLDFPEIKKDKETVRWISKIDSAFKKIVLNLVSKTEVETICKILKDSKPCPISDILCDSFSSKFFHSLPTREKLDIIAANF